MSWWNSFEVLSKVQTALAIVVSVVGFATLTVKLRADYLKKQIDAKRVEERTRLDAELREQTARAIRLSAETDARTKPRSLTNEQKSSLIAKLRPLVGVEGIAIVYPSGDGEAQSFAQTISDTFTEAGVKPFLTFWLGSPIPSGVSVLSRSEASDKAASAISSSFVSSAIPTKYMRGGFVPEKTISILIGTKP